MLKIWGRTTSSNVQKVLWCCGEIGIAFEREDIGGEFGGNKSPDYLALNPNGLVPTIDEDGFILWESNVIVRYLAAKYGAGSLDRKLANKRALKERVGLGGPDDVALLATVARLTHQKGIDLLVDALPQLVALPGQVIVVGAGDRVLAQRLRAACKRFPLKKRRRITFEYVLLAGVNDSDEDARRLAKLLGGMKAKVNLIPLNAAAGIPFERPSDAAIDRFAKIVADHGVLVSVRKSRGRDIRAACGQLIVEGQKKSAGQQLATLAFR